MLNSDEINKEIGKRIKNARQLKGFSQDKIGKETGISKNTIWKIENGLRAARGDEIVLISKALDINPIFLLDFTKPDINEVTKLVDNYCEEVKQLTDNFVLDLTKQLNSENN